MTECARCGDCCVRIQPNTGPETWEKSAAAGDPRDDANWPQWLSAGWVDRVKAAKHYESACFVSTFWSANPDGTYKCDAFDADTRLCTAHEQRPPICRDFPWYGRDPLEDTAPPLATYPDGRPLLPLRCSFWADVPSDRWPAGTEPLPSPVAIRTLDKHGEYQKAAESGRSVK